MERDRRACIACCSLVLAVLAHGCGARTDLDTPPPVPPPPCMLDDTIPTIPPCRELELREAVMLSESVLPGRVSAHVDQHAASPHLGGAAVSYLMRLSGEDFPAHDVEERVLVLDAEARARGGPQTILSEHIGAVGPGSYVTSVAAPSVSGGCEVHALGHLKIFEPFSETARLAIAGDDGLELVELEPAYVWDLRREGEVLSWLELHLDGRGLHQGFADRRGRLLRRSPLERFGAFSVGSVSRHPLGDGTFVMPVEHEAPGGLFTELAHYDEGGTVVASHPLAPGLTGHTVIGWRDGERWLFWSELTEPDRLSARRTLHAARLADDGSLAPALAFELDGLDGMSRFTPAWIGGHWLLPVFDRETDTSSLGVFDEAGNQQALLRLGASVAHAGILQHTAHVVPTPSGAIVTYEEARVLEARTVRCAAP